MKLIALIGVAFVAMIVLSVPTASAAWKPGTTYYVTIDDAEDYIDDVADYASCLGIPRFGMHNVYGDKEYTTFDCTIKRDDLYCTDWRWRAVRGAKPGYFRMKSIRLGSCY